MFSALYYTFCREYPIRTDASGISRPNGLANRPLNHLSNSLYVPLTGLEPAYLPLGIGSIIQLYYKGIFAVRVGVEPTSFSLTGCRFNHYGTTEPIVEGVGFEPTKQVTPLAGFQDQCTQPLCEPSISSRGSETRTHTTLRLTVFKTASRRPTWIIPLY
jgi:hypothetical protein